MTYSFHPEARQEYMDAAEYYSDIRSILGVAFSADIESVIQRICDGPTHWGFLERDVRRCPAKRFPYAVLYTVEGEHFFIIAVMHSSRRPGYWRDRL